MDNEGMKLNMDEFETVPKWDLNYTINYIKEHFIQILMLIGVFVIIYAVDALSQYNMMIYSMPSAIPGLPAQNTPPTSHLPKKMRKSKK